MPFDEQQDKDEDVLPTEQKRAKNQDAGGGDEVEQPRQPAGEEVQQRGKRVGPPTCEMSGLSYGQYARDFLTTLRFSGATGYQTTFINYQVRDFNGKTMSELRSEPVNFNPATNTYELSVSFGGGFLPLGKYEFLYSAKNDDGTSATQAIEFDRMLPASDAVRQGAEVSHSRQYLGALSTRSCAAPTAG